jgi:hypothetical protein
MDPGSGFAFIAFDGDRCIATGDLREVARAAKETLERDKEASILVFDCRTSGPIEIDFRGTSEEVLARLPTSAPAASDAAAQPASRGPGRPKLGVVAREVTLLPRHWEWLARQSGGASVALRKLVEEARRASEFEDRVRESQEATYRFMSVMAGNKPKYEDAIRALFAGDLPSFKQAIAGWAADVRDHTRRLAAAAFERATAQDSPASEKMVEKTRRANRE